MIMFRNFCPMLVFTFALNGGLNHVILRDLLRFLGFFVGGAYCSVCLYPLLCSASWYGIIPMAMRGWHSRVTECNSFALNQGILKMGKEEEGKGGT